ncbi:hypothetical protein L195_g050215, partial [Trifolium pratense]
MLQLDNETAYQKKIDLLKRKLEKATLGAEVKKVHETCDFCHENHPNGYCVPEGISDEEYAKYMRRLSPYSSWGNQNPMWNQNSAQGAQHTQQPRKPSPLEEAFNQFVKISQTNFENMQTTVVNQGASIKNLETRIGQLTKLITNFSKDYAGNTIDNPTKEEWLTLEEAYDEFMEELDEYYEETPAERLNIESKLPIKRKDLGTFTIPCCLGKVQEKALCDLGSNINLMPLKFVKKWEIGELNTNYEKKIVLAEQSIIHPTGIIKDVIVKVNNLLFPVDFTVVDIEEDVDVPIILGRPFL